MLSSDEFKTQFYLLIFQDICERLDLGVLYIGTQQRNVYFQLTKSTENDVKIASKWAMTMAKAYLLSFHKYNNIPINGTNTPDKFETLNIREP